MLLLQLTSLVIFKGREILHFDLVYLNIYFVLCFVKGDVFVHKCATVKGYGFVENKTYKGFCRIKLLKKKNLSY